MKKLLVTGATGLIGRETLPMLSASGLEIHAIATHRPVAGGDVNWHVGSLFDHDFVSQLVEAVRPQYLLNLAWATTGDYLVNPVNEQFLEAGKNLTRKFAEFGGRRAVYVGSCFEYRFKADPIRESDELSTDRNLYTHCKDELRRYADRMFEQHGVSFGYGRIFYVFGRHEATSRLTGMVLDHLLRNEPIVIKSGPLEKDYIYARDVAGALVKFLLGEVRGCVNISSGSAVSIREFVTTLANILQRTHLLEFKDEIGNQPPRIVGDNTRLVQEVGYVPRYGLAEAFGEIISATENGM